MFFFWMYVWFLKYETSYFLHNTLPFEQAFTHSKLILITQKQWSFRSWLLMCENLDAMFQSQHCWLWIFFVLFIFFSPLFFSLFFFRLKPTRKVFSCVQEKGNFPVENFITSRFYFSSHVLLTSLKSHNITYLSGRGG